MTKIRSIICIAIIAILALAIPHYSLAQEDKDSTSILRLHGLVQTDIQMGQEESILGVGKPNQAKESTFYRAGLRRGLFSVEAVHPTLKGWSAVGTIDITERGVLPFQAHLKYRRSFFLDDEDEIPIEVEGRTGLDIVNFGLEASEPLSARLSPEASPYLSNIFPDMVDLGIGGVCRIRFGGYTPEYLRHTIGIGAYALSGNGLGEMRKNRPDILLNLRHQMSNIYLDILYGGSYYVGSVPQSSDQGRDVRRNYLSLFARIGFSTELGYTRLSGEYVFGNHPGKRKSPTVVGKNIEDESYYDGQRIFSREFRGVMGELSHRLYTIPIALLYKFTHYDKRHLISGDKELWQLYLDQLVASPEADGRESIHGIGAQLFLFKDNLRLTAFYEIKESRRVPNPQHKLYKDPQDNTLTLRIQYSF